MYVHISIYTYVLYPHIIVCICTRCHLAQDEQPGGPGDPPAAPRPPRGRGHLEEAAAWDPKEGPSNASPSTQMAGPYRAPLKGIHIDNCKYRCGCRP